VVVFDLDDVLALAFLVFGLPIARFNDFLFAFSPLFHVFLPVLLRDLPPPILPISQLSDLIQSPRQHGQAF
jgi:hypothetical protein